MTESALMVGQAGPLPQLRAMAQAVLLSPPDGRTPMRVKQADPAVILVDILSEVGAVPAICRAAFGRFRSATQRGLGAIAAETKDVDVAELLRAPEIEESFSLGADLTASFFGSAGNWLPMARLASRRASRNAGLVDQAEAQSNWHWRWKSPGHSARGSTLPDGASRLESSWVVRRAMGEAFALRRTKQPKKLSCALASHH